MLRRQIPKEVVELVYQDSDQFSIPQVSAFDLQLATSRGVDVDRSNRFINMSYLFLRL